MEWGGFLVVIGLFLDMLGVLKLAESTLPKRLAKLLKYVELPSNPDEATQKVEIGYTFNFLRIWVAAFWNIIGNRAGKDLT